MGKKGNSAGKAAAKAAKRDKQEKLASRKANKDDKKKNARAPPPTTKAKGKGKKAAAPAEEEDLDALLKQFDKEWQEAHAVNEETVGGPPTRRANATLTPCPGGNDLWLFGGEYFDGDRATFYADLYRYTPPTTLPSRSLITQEDGTTAADPSLSSSSNAAAGTWRLYSSPNQPGPRSAHQVVADPRAGGLLWLFGGEFASPKQTSFHHYRDLWVFSISSKTWERVDTKTRPSARSGHRMALWRQYLVLFGGFVDTGARTTYLQDLWLFDTSQYKWFEISQNDLKRPPARSGFSLISTPEGVILHGGYCKRYVKGQRTQGVALEDTWMLKLTPQADGSLLPANTAQGGKIEWEKRRKIGYAPGARSGCTMALWGNKSMGVLFGGVMDREDDEESMESVLFNDLFGYNIPGAGRWISLNLRKKKKQQAAGGKKKREKAAAAAAAAAAKTAEIEAREREKEEEERQLEHDDSDSGSESGSDKDGAERGEQGREGEGREKTTEVQNGTITGAGGAARAAPVVAPADFDEDDPELTRPYTRFNTMLAIQRNTLYLYGGIHETAEREYTLDDFHVLQLDKLERWISLRDCKIEGLEWNESDEESEDENDSDDSESESSSSDEDGGAQEGVEVASLHSHSEDEEADEQLDSAQAEERRREREAIKRKAKAAWGVVKGSGAGAGSEGEAVNSEDRKSTPNPGETLRMFFDRTRDFWSSRAFEVTRGEARGKEMRTKGFELAEARYEEYKPVLREVEKIQAEAGLDEADMRAAAQRAAHGPLGGGSQRQQLEMRAEAVSVWHPGKPISGTAVVVSNQCEALVGLDIRTLIFWATSHSRSFVQFLPLQDFRQDGAHDDEIAPEACIIESNTFASRGTYICLILVTIMLPLSINGVGYVQGSCPDEALLEACGASLGAIVPS
ncbi:hypothetical protein BDZ90DRAFT_225927 [Jaminaea rosea]|uniref:DUF4110 domain-containing protein n=1 Tax=Jaminaea rosea TaxID=1569628 RepID=A0A316V2J2_9BASI|nr:hypothetical protein BDZ90DRAFT_225927 [Jaminaea rosea]PWN29645.1 hypothetical protein BDZ90DRAFT_225927 [Jaminaea rosea]